MRLPDPSPVLDKNRAPIWVQKFYPQYWGWGLEKRLLWHFQTPVLYWINFQSAHVNQDFAPDFPRGFLSRRTSSHKDEEIKSGDKSS